MVVFFDQYLLFYNYVLVKQFKCTNTGSDIHISKNQIWFFDVGDAGLASRSHEVLKKVKLLPGLELN